MNLGRGAKTVLLIAAVVVAFAGIKLASSLLVPLLLAGFIATVSAPLVFWLCEKGVPKGLAVLMALALDIAVLGAIGVLVGSSVNTFYKRLPIYQSGLAETLTAASDWLSRYGIAPDSLNEAGQIGSAMEMVAWLLQSLAGILSNVVLVLLLVTFMLLEATGLRSKFETIVGGESARARRAAKEMKTYLVVKTGTSLLTGLCVGVWLAIWDVDLPVLWGLLAFLLAYVPTIGAIVAGVPPLMLAVIQFGPGNALLVTTGYVGINLAIGVVEPRVFGRALGLSPLVVFLSVILWGWLLGPIGALLSVPLTMMVKIAARNTQDMRWVAILLASAEKADLLAEEAAQEGVSTSIRGSELPPPMATGDPLQPGE